MIVYIVWVYCVLHLIGAGVALGSMDDDEPKKRNHGLDIIFAGIGAIGCGTALVFHYLG